MHVHGRLTRVTACLCNMTNITKDMFKGTIQRAPHMRVISVYNRPIRLLPDHDSLSDVFKLNRLHAAIGWYL